MTRATIDGCDGNDPKDDPRDEKYGGTFYGTDGWEFTLTPRANRMVGDTCDVSYKVLYDFFEVRGKNFPPTLDAAGNNLKDAISHCTGANGLKNWNFVATPTDCCYQWYANGTMPIGQKSCIGNAVITVGGSTKGDCTGAG